MTVQVQLLKVNEPTAMAAGPHNTVADAAPGLPVVQALRGAINPLAPVNGRQSRAFGDLQHALGRSPEGVSELRWLDDPHREWQLGDPQYKPLQGVR
jgi:hypothetical protein